MRTACCLPTECVLLAATRCHYWIPTTPGYITRIGYSHPLPPGRDLGPGIPIPPTPRRDLGLGIELHPTTCGQTDAYENITFRQLLVQEVIIYECFKKFDRKLQGF